MLNGFARQIVRRATMERNPVRLTIATFAKESLFSWPKNRNAKAFIVTFLSVYLSFSARCFVSRSSVPQVSSSFAAALSDRTSLYSETAESETEPSESGADCDGSGTGEMIFQRIRLSPIEM